MFNWSCTERRSQHSVSFSSFHMLSTSVTHYYYTFITNMVNTFTGIWSVTISQASKLIPLLLIHSWGSQYCTASPLFLKCIYRGEEAAAQGWKKSLLFCVQKNLRELYIVWSHPTVISSSFSRIFQFDSSLISSLSHTSSLILSSLIYLYLFIYRVYLFAAPRCRQAERSQCWKLDTILNL